MAPTGAGMSPSAGVNTAYRFPIPARIATAAGSYQLDKNGAFTMVFSRLANLRTRRDRSRAPIVTIGGHDGPDELWQPLGPVQAQGATLALAPAVRQQGQWQVQGQARRQQTTLSDLTVIYQRFLFQTERKRPYAHFK